ncbi:MAG: LLM class flavin-dependent oxidoreductase [Myxococcota bacterium]
MNYDIFFSISQTPVAGVTPSERDMFANFFDQVRVADELGFGTAWIAEAHLSTESQKKHERPVVPHWQGEIGLNVDVFQLAHRVFATTERIEVGSAVMNLLSNGGPVAAAERIAYFATLHGADAAEKRRLNIGFSAGRFDFMNRAYGIVPRDAVEAAAWPVVRGKIFAEATEVFVRLLAGEELDGSMTEGQALVESDFRKAEDWERVVEAAGERRERYELAKRYPFEPLRIIPADWRRELVQLVIGSHDPKMQVFANRWLPVQVFNLSITAPDVIEQTHERMREAYRGGGWERSFMPRTTFVFLNDEDGLTEESKAQAAQEEARAALGAYWTALEGTLDPAKVEKATTNALVGNVEQVAAQAVERFHPDDRLMLWFDFFNHDSDRVIRNMRAFQEKVRPRIEEATRR